MVIDSDDEHYPEYVPPGTLTPIRAARTSRATPTKVAPGRVTTSLFEEDHILTGTRSRSSTHSERASMFDEAYDFEEESVFVEAFGFEEASTSPNTNAPATSV